MSSIKSKNYNIAKLKSIPTPIQEGCDNKDIIYYEKEESFKEKSALILKESYEEIDFFMSNFLKKNDIKIERYSCYSYSIRYSKIDSNNNNSYIYINIDSEYIEISYEIPDSASYISEKTTIKDSYFFKKWESELETAYLNRLNNNSHNVLKKVMEVTKIDRINKLNAVLKSF